MFSRFWSSDSRGGKPTELGDTLDATAGYTVSAAHDDACAVHASKRRRADSIDNDAQAADVLPKRPKLSDRIQEQIDNAGSVMDSLDSAEDKIESAFQLQILIKHEEKRLIDTRIAECQAALEQLRRVHLKPYPINCPTPQQMLDISAGKGHSLQRPDEPVPTFAPPYGVVDGPYSRHYQRWLIPHRDFDGVDYDAQQADPSRSKASFAEGRTTRYSFGEPSAFSRGRPSRSAPSAKLQALQAGQAPRKATAGPCVLKRSDGQVVKLVCIDCHRENFSSTQGFINHCRIAHKRDFKSHEEAAVKCGQPYKSPEPGSTGSATSAEERTSASAPTPAPAPAPAPAPIPAPVPAAPRQSCVVNPLVKSGGTDMTYNEACASLSARLRDVIKVYSQDGPNSKPTATKVKVERPRATAGEMEASSETPHLSRLLQRRKFSGNLRELVKDAKTSVSLDDITPDEDSDDGEPVAATAMVARTPVVKRVPVVSADTPTPTGRPISSKAVAHGIKTSDSPAPNSSSSNSNGNSNGGGGNRHGSSDEDAEMEEPSLSPTTLIANNAPSLVSDDGEYDDSDEGSSDAGHGEELEDAHSLSDVADITMDEDGDHPHRTLRRTSTGVSSAVRLGREDAKQRVSFIGAVTGNNGNERRKRKA
ncbi:ADA HAT complex component 1 [Geosmithia morbida]|uniref:ADA HAT complex component 1 n=1 Tax=Geosmithia morbida TaxID=1094350 RepID=A0A9P5D6P0_9HYPO|nr:ADA HAT complex component 1 [Geosmithia morbida]KAF4125791.1 ADA HAT complex component 1 [Geosmithia morbida]